jgi:uncharacterized protein (PEP-CTERM system associated)
MPGMAMATGTGMRDRWAGLSVAGLAGLACAAALAQESEADDRTLRARPRIALAETWTDNVRLSPAHPQLDQITEVSPGIRIDLQGERVNAYVDYTFSEIAYRQSSVPRKSQNALNAFGTLEVIDGWAFVDMNGAIARQTISAFGTQSGTSTSLDANQTELSTFRISPYVRGRLGDIASYQARYSRSVTDSDSPTVKGVSVADAAINVAGDFRLSKLGWSADVTQHRIDYSQGRSTDDDRLQLGMSYTMSSQFKVQANAGWEYSNYTTPDQRRRPTTGIGVSWFPSELTRLSASLTHRSFGDTHQLSIDHRTARTAWRISDVRDIATTPGQASVQSQGSVYDLLFSQFASVEPNLVARAQLVNAYLQASGISPDAMAGHGFLASSVYLQRRQDLLFALLGVRDTVTFMTTRSDSRRLDMLSPAVDDLATVTQLRQLGWSMNLSHRLTPDYALAALVSRRRSTGAVGLQHSALSMFSLNLTGRQSKHASVSLGLRRAIASGTAHYDETAVILNLILQL